MGRPRKSEPRNRQLNLSFTDAELEAICRRAQAVGMRPVHFGRALLLDPDRALAPAQNNVERLIQRELARLGNNLNQTVRKLNSLGLPLPADLEPLLADIRAMLAQVPR